FSFWRQPLLFKGLATQGGLRCHPLVRQLTCSYQSRENRPDLAADALHGVVPKGPEYKLMEHVAYRQIRLQGIYYHILREQFEVLQPNGRGRMCRNVTGRGNSFYLSK